MRRNIPRVPIPPDPVLLDNVIADIQPVLADKLPWLTHSFGRAERQAKARTLGAYPALYVGYFDNKRHFQNDYLDLRPDDKLGSFCFWYNRDPMDYETYAGQIASATSTISLIFWYDVTKAVGSRGQRGTEQIKRDVVEVLNNEVFPTNGHVTVNTTYDSLGEVFDAFDTRVLDDHLMHPYAGLRVDMEIKTTFQC